MIAHRTAASVQLVLRERLFDKVVELGPGMAWTAGCSACYQPAQVIHDKVNDHEIRGNNQLSSDVPREQQAAVGCPRVET